MIAILVGHSFKAQGAYNETKNVTEWVYNNELASLLFTALCEMGETPVILSRQSTIAKTCEVVNRMSPKLCIELHCNAFNDSVSGTETLYWHSSSKGKAMALKIQKAMVDTLGINDRGIKPISYGDRGATVLQSTYCPCILIEPFFIDNTQDLAKGVTHKRTLANAIAKAIMSESD